VPMMIKIWKLDFDANNYNNIIPINSEEWEKLDFDGTSVLNNWTPITFRTLPRFFVNISFEAINYN
jgi:hypothetical protein